MPRTKRRFEDVSASSQPYLSRPVDEDMEDEVEAGGMAPPTTIPGNRGGGKMMFLQRPGKQMRTLVEQEEDSEEEDDDEEEEEEEEEIAYPPVHRGGKTFRHMGGKQLNLPSVAHESSDDEEEDDDEDYDEIEPIVAPSAAPSSRASGKSLANMQPIGGKQFRPPFPVQDDDDDSENESEGSTLVRIGSGKMFPPAAKSTVQSKPTIANTQVNEDEDMDGDYKNDTNEVKPSAINKASVNKEPSKPQQSLSSRKPKDTVKPASTMTKGKIQSAKKSTGKKRVVLEEFVGEEEDDFDDELSDHDDKESINEPDEDEDMDPEDLQQHHLIQGEADQTYLDSLPELEREEILAERYERRKNELEMKKVLRDQRYSLRSSGIDSHYHSETFPS